MLKAGLLPSPTITPLSNSVSSKNKIDTQTFVELRSGTYWLIVWIYKNYPVRNSINLKNFWFKVIIFNNVTFSHHLDIPNVRIYFTVDGTKPDPFQTFKTGRISTYLYKGAFRLDTGRRVVKAVAVST